MAIGDFHLHSTASDGVHTPTWVMETAARRGVRFVSLTDHDSTEGLAEARKAADRLGLQLVPGIELSADLGKVDVHLLAYGFDVKAKPLQDFLAWQRDGRIGRTRQIVEILAAHGMPLDIDRVFEIAGEATVGRPHVARALLERGYVESVQEAFDLWLGNGKPADVDRPKLHPADAIKVVHDNGGVVFIAHPVFLGDDYEPIIAQLAEWGADGVETYYKHYDAATIEKHARIAAKLGLGASGGSDYHGLGNPDDREIGDIPFPDDRVEAFLSFLRDKGVDTGATV
ncbi:MAG: PHP domain-containing protein [Dehalococcoidia bacterium]|nr:PHP domain-containing protein [Dehalococcoidia bacterium]